MSKFKFSKKLLKFTTIAATGGAIGAAAAAPGHARGEEAKRGLFTGALLGAGVVIAPRLFKTGVARSAARGAVKNVKRHAMVAGKVVFRRIKGRIVPVRLRK